MISVPCPSCGARLRGPDQSAGKKIKCPKCGGIVPVPEKIYEPEPLVDDRPPAGAYDLDEPVLPARSSAVPGGGGGDDDGRKPCPVCGEMIVATAAKCRFCGEVFDAKLKKAKTKSKKKRGNSEDDDLSTTDIALCLLCPGIACIASIVYMIQGKGKGIKAFGLSILGSVIWNVVNVIIQSALKNQGGP